MTEFNIKPADLAACRRYYAQRHRTAVTKALAFWMRAAADRADVADEMEVCS